MNLQNGYKVIYEKAADGKRTFYASKTGLFADAELITEATIGEYSLIYEKDGRFYGSATGIPTEQDHCFEAFDKVFKEAQQEQAAASYARKRTTTKKSESAVEEPSEAVKEEAVVEEK